MPKRVQFPAVLLVAALVSLLTGCTSKMERLKAFLREPRSPVAGTEYRVLPPDIVAIRSLHIPEINNVRQQVRPDGKVNLPLIGEVTVAGLTAQEIEAALTKAARDYYEQVDATVEVAAFNSQKIYVFGQVSRPGPQAWTGTNSLLDLLAQAQPTQLAWPERIRVVRGRPPTSGGYLPGEVEKIVKEAEAAPAAPAAAAAEEEKPVAQVEAEGAVDKPPAVPATPARDKAAVMVVNMMKMVKKGDMSHNVMLQPDDVIYVPANPLAAVGLAIQQVLFPIRPATETVSLPASAANLVAP